MARFNFSDSILKNDGFTLMEVLIAITVLAFISLSTFKMVNTNTDTKEQVVKEDRVIVQTLTAVGRLDADISQLVNPLYASAKQLPSANASGDPYADTNSNANGAFDGKTETGELIPQFKSEDKSTIIFFTQSNRRKNADSKESRNAWIRYSLKAMEPDPDNPDDKTSGFYNLVRQSIATDIYNPTLDWDKPKSQIVMEKIKSLEFSFWDERGKKYTTSLQDLNENKNIIRALKVNIVWVDDQQNEQKFEKTFRILTPYFNTKLDAVKNPTGGGIPGGAAQDPNNPVLPPGEGDEQF